MLQSEMSYVANPNSVWSYNTPHTHTASSVLYAVDKGLRGLLYDIAVAFVCLKRLSCFLVYFKIESVGDHTPFSLS